MMDALNQYYYCFKGKSALIHTDDTICTLNRLYIWQDDIFQNEDFVQKYTLMDLFI